MSQRHLEQKAIRGFTLIEMLVTVAMIGILASFSGAIYLRARARSRTIHCLANQQQLTGALIAFYEDNSEFPKDGHCADLAIALSPYIPWPTGHHNVALPGVYFCPNDRAGKLSNSYEPYYVRRKEPWGSDYFVLGCPRHEDADGTYLNTLGMHGATYADAGRIMINGITVSAEAPVRSRSMGSGVMAFEDHSIAMVDQSSDNLHVTALASFRLEDGRLYSIARIEGNGETTFNVAPGSKFEVVTPVAIIGVRGTSFTVSTTEGQANVIVTSGSVHVWDRVIGRDYVVEAPDVTESAPAPTDVAALCIHCDKHCRDGEHCSRCPLHVGKPENIGTSYCVECPSHCPADPLDLDSKEHCRKFCFLADDDD